MFACDPTTPADAGPRADAAIEDASTRDASRLDGGPCALVLTLPGDALPGDAEREVGADCAVTLESPGPRVVELWVEDGAFSGALGDGAHLGPMVVEAGAHALVVGAASTLHLRDHGEVPAAITIPRSLTWTDPVLLDDPAVVGLDRVMRSAAGDVHGGLLLDRWLRRFATTAHSERALPTRFLDEQVTAQGTDDPTAWELDSFPFVVTGVHARVDLADGAHCGELRVSLASTHAILQPFHMIALYRQAPTARDLRPDGSAHCAATALRWARLSALDDDAFRAAARAWLDEALTRERFLALETVELLISPWEWRQWFLEPSALDPRLPEVFENLPLFNTVDTPRLNAPGPDRDAFLAYVEANADALADRRLTLPSRFRAASARVNEGVPWIPLDLSGVSSAVTARHPELRQRIEIVGCPACHVADAHFVQTLPDRTFSPFYTKELMSREAYLRAMAEGRAMPAPHGPLQDEPVLPP